MTPTELRKRVLMTPLSDFEKFPILLHTPDFVLTSSAVGPMFSLRGQDKRGQPWQVILRDAVRGSWQSGVRERRTYYFAGYTGAAGSGPATWILALSFDEGGKPVPFFVTTHGGYGANGIEDVFDLDGTGPEFLEQSLLGEYPRRPRLLRDGALSTAGQLLVSVGWTARHACISDVRKVVGHVERPIC